MRSSTFLALSSLLFVACGGSSTAPDAATPDGGAADAPATDLAPVDHGSSCTTDSDADGHRSLDCGGDDCDDTDPNRYPGNPERCDTLGHDEDCDTSTLGPDADHDTFVPNDCCNTQGDGTMRCGEDCDDGRATVNPTAGESCNGLDDDCNGEVDDHGVLLVFSRDVDADGYGDDTMTMSACSTPTGYSLMGGDCNDASATVHPGAGDACGDGVDNDCNGAIDDGVHLDCYPDGDHDGFTTSGASRVPVCGDSLGHCPSGYTDLTPADGATTDCDDAQSTRHPGAIENCNSIDDDCDGTIDDGAGIPQWRDADGDGHSAGAMALACVVMTGYVTTAPDDCDDTRSDTHPGAPEACDGRDEDCDAMDDRYSLDARDWCESLPHTYRVPGGMRPVCIAASLSVVWTCNHYGTLDYRCADGWGECDTGYNDSVVIGANGCETDFTRSPNCGVCGQVCGGGYPYCRGTADFSGRVTYTCWPTP